MNIRNLIFIATIFCAAPVVCADIKVNLAKQEQDTIKQWVKQVKHLPSESKKIVKMIVSLTKDYVSITLDKVMRVGKDRAECAQELIKGYEAFGEIAAKEFKSLKKKVKKSHGMETFFQEIDEILESCPLAVVTVTESTSTTDTGLSETEISISFGDDLLFSFETMITAQGKESAPMSKGGIKVITEEDIASMKRVLAQYLFALECL